MYPLHYLPSLCFLEFSVTSFPFFYLEGAARHLFLELTASFCSRGDASHLHAHVRKSIKQACNQLWWPIINLGNTCCCLLFLLVNLVQEAVSCTKLYLMTLLLYEPHSPSHSMSSSCGSTPRVMKDVSELQIDAQGWALRHGSSRKTWSMFPT